MGMRCLELVLLLWVPGLLQAQGPQPCSTPSLDAGFLLPVQESYPHGTKISYSCNDGYKAEGRGWWGTSTCFNGLWFGIPVCIIYPPTCHEPPRISNAAIINQDFQDVFTQDTEVVYQCKDGYTTKEGATKKSVFCRAGVWTDVPTCVPAASACVLDLQRLDIGATSQISIKDGETKEIDCTLWQDYSMFARCSNGRIEATKCCHITSIKRNHCRFSEAL
ncbi:complement factor H-like [Xiphophorus maculatus]|uniref:complement factor H-like n=1 Tax=Xiphophorus maculatus TaxID=8083 RepID=UPI000C6DC3BC|nr:complement factor H-like [Xiphophorus maculatus]